MNESTSIWGLIVLLGSGAFVIGAGIWSIFNMHYQIKHCDDAYSEQEEPSLSRRWGKVLEKRVEMVQTGTLRDPAHHVEYRVLFQLADGSEKWMKVPQDIFEKIPDSASGEILMEGDTLLDFDGLLGENLQS